MTLIQYVLFWLSKGRFSNPQRGATLIEYVLIVAVIAIAVLVAGDATGVVDAIGHVFRKATNSLEDA